MAGLEVIRTLNDLGVETEAPLEVVVWTNEEGSRFAPCMMGSGVFAGKFTLEETLAKRDAGRQRWRGAERHRLCRPAGGARAPGGGIF
jgi:hypothetical protein